MKQTLIFCIFIMTVLTLPFCTTTKNVAKGNTDLPQYHYVTDVAPVIAERCTPCHFPETGKKLPLDTYAAVSNNIDDILTRVQLPHNDPKFMPFKSKKEPLSDSLIMVLKLWKEGGMDEVKG